MEYVPVGDKDKFKCWTECYDNELCSLKAILPWARPDGLTDVFITAPVFRETISSVVSQH